MHGLEIIQKRMQRMQQKEQRRFIRTMKNDTKSLCSEVIKNVSLEHLRKISANNLSFIILIHLKQFYNII